MAAGSTSLLLSLCYKADINTRARHIHNHFLDVYSSKCINGRHPPSKTPVGVRAALDMPEWSEMTEQIDWREKQPSRVACFSEDLECWEAWDTTAGTKPRISHQWSPRGERGAERGSARQSSLKGRERAIVSQTNIGTVSKAALGKLLRDGVERIKTILNWTTVLMSTTIWQTKCYGCGHSLYYLAIDETNILSCQWQPKISQNGTRFKISPIFSRLYVSIHLCCCCCC